MSYALLRSLYFGSGANADITVQSDREKLHVKTPLDESIPAFLRQGRDVVLTGNPGDGKSHLARMMLDRGDLGGVEVELDLSANTSADVAKRWSGAVDRGAPYLLCANEGPLTSLIPELVGLPSLSGRARELDRQLGRLVCARPEDLPAEPEGAVLIDLADRNVVDRRLVASCLDRVCTYDFMPDLGVESAETSAGINIALFVQAPAARARLGELLEIAGRRSGAHVTFRQLWQTVAFALTGGKDERALRREHRADKVGHGTYPLDHLCDGRGNGPLIDAMRTLTDPAEIPVPDLDEAIWTRGEPRTGDWMFDDVVTHVPATAWMDGDPEQAFETFRSLKRLVALAHEEGGRILEALREADPYLPSERDDDRLKRELAEGLRGLYLSPSQQAQAPEWLSDGVPLWVSNTYQDDAVEERPHVATDVIFEGEFAVLRPHRVPWLASALGPPPEVAWLLHGQSKVALRVDAHTLRALHLAAKSDGPIGVPEPVARFLTRLAGWRERANGACLGEERFAVLDKPRGRIAASGAVRHLVNEGAEYGGE